MRDKAKELLNKMTLNEKIAQLHSIWLYMEGEGNIQVKSLSGMQNSVGSRDFREELKYGIGQITRPLGSQDIDPVAGVRNLNLIQKYLVENTRLGIPALPHEECLSGLMARGGTIFPAAINNGATWEPDLMEEIGKAIGSELHSTGSRQGLAPVLDVCRDARWGRTEETYGEDPYLSGIMATAYVKGLQNESRPLLATLKHYAAHSFGEGGRNHAPVRVGERELNDLFLYPFEMAVKYGRARSLMPAYHDIDGEPLHQSSRYLNHLLRERWGFEGIIVSDYEGLIQLITDHHVHSDKAGAAAATLNAGVDVELPGNSLFQEGIKSALDKGLLKMEVVDEAVMRHLTEKYRLGLFDNPYTGEESIQLQSEEAVRLAKKGAEKSLVLLKNNGILPLKGDGKIALIGPLADEPMAMMGGYAFPVHLIVSEQREGSSHVKTLRESLEKEYGSRLYYHKGCDILTRRPDKPAVFPGDVPLDGSQQIDYISYDMNGFEAALEQARKADTVILAVGDLAGLFQSGTVGEGSDVSSLALPGVQQQLIESVLELGKPTVIVLFSGRPYHLEEANRKCSALIQAWLPGQEGGPAVTGALLGKVNPGGKLPLSFPREAGSMPFYYNHKMKCAGTPIQKDFGAEYPFGFGLSYTDFTLSEIELDKAIYKTDDTIKVSLTVSNTGDRDGDEVIQIYVRDKVARFVRPLKELKAFKRIHLPSGESRSLEFSIPTDMLSYTVEFGKRIVEPGEFLIMIGNSSTDIKSEFSIGLEGPVRELASQWHMVSSVTEL